MTNAEEVADAIDNAADLIEKIGWCQEAMTETNDDDEKAVIAYCSLGALAHPNKTSMYFQATKWLADAICRRWGLSPARSNRIEDREALISEWNDEECRTKQEVLDVFRSAAKRVRTGELS